MLLMTPWYASPEQAQGKPLGVASDIFSLATLLYKLLTGVLPYPIEQSGPLEAIRMITEADPKLPSKASGPALSASLRGDIDTILLMGLRKEPARRYPTVAALSADVSSHLQSRPVQAHADSMSYRAGKFVLRNRIWAVAALTVAVITTISLTAVVRRARWPGASERRCSSPQQMPCARRNRRKQPHMKPSSNVGWRNSRRSSPIESEILPRRQPLLLCASEPTPRDASTMCRTWPASTCRISSIP